MNEDSLQEIANSIDELSHQIDTADFRMLIDALERHSDILEKMYNKSS